MKRGDHLLVACSGGPDSVAMLRALSSLAPRRGWELRLSVAHVQHHLRPESASEGDAVFVERLCRRLALPLLRTDLGPIRDGNVESQARRGRYAALLGMAQLVGARFVAVAHHADDQLETVLMRLVRGSSLRGLAGMAWRRRMTRTVTLVRPLLGVDRAAVRDYLRQLRQPSRSDATNHDVRRWRARLRRDVLPVLRQLRPDAAGKAVALGDKLRAAARLVDRQVRQLTRTMDAGAMSRGELRGLSALVLGGLLRRVLGGAGVPRDAMGSRALAPLVRAVRDRVGGERRFEFRHGVRVTVTRERVSVASLPSGRRPRASRGRRKPASLSQKRARPRR